MGIAVGLTVTTLLVTMMLYHTAFVTGFAVTVDVQEESCFYEQVSSGTKLGIIFQVAEGGFLDIDLTVSRRTLGVACRL